MGEKGHKVRGGCGAVICLRLPLHPWLQVNEVLPMLKRGVGVHHSGLLPLVKEVIELLFQEGLLKVFICSSEPLATE